MKQPGYLTITSSSGINEHIEVTLNGLRSLLKTWLQGFTDLVAQRVHILKSTGKINAYAQCTDKELIT